MKIMSYKELLKESIESKRRYFIEIVDNYPGVSINAIATVMGSNKSTIEKLIDKIGLHKLFTCKSRNMSIKFRHDFINNNLAKSNRLEPHTIVVHGGCFHADDVFSVALAKIIWGESLQVVRVNSVSNYMTMRNGYLVADIGGGDYDHHSALDKKCRDNYYSTPYAAFGLLMKAFYKDPYLGLTDDQYESLDSRFVAVIDSADNGASKNLLSSTIASMNAQWNENCNPDTRFMEAVDIAKVMLTAWINRVKSESEATTIVGSVEIKDGGAMLDKYVPVGNLLEKRGAAYVGFPSNRGGYNVMYLKRNGIPLGSFDPAMNEDERDKSGITFIHNTGFMACFIDRRYAESFMKYNR